MSKVPWSQLNDEQFESMVACLLKTLFADADKIDGSGGDGGRDVRVMTPTGELMYQIKYLQPRLSNAQGHRSQVARSLARAAQTNPRDWTLIVPIDLTEGEQIWLQKLGARYSFPVHFHGATWLNAQMAKHPQISRYFLEDNAAEVVRLMTVLQREQAALAGGIADASERISALADQIDLISPFYRVDWSVVGGRRTLEVVPRYRGAEVDSPIVVGVITDFPNTPAGRKAATEYQALIDYGTPVQIRRQHLKGIEFHGEPGLMPPLVGATVLIGPTEDDQNFVADAMFEVRDTKGQILATLPIVLSGRTRGNKGVVIKGSESQGVLTIELLMRFDGSGSIRLGYKLPDSFYPATVLPVLRFLSCCHPGNSATLSIARTTPITLHLAGGQLRGASTTYRILTALAHVQLRCGTLFPISTLTKADQAKIWKLDALVRGEPYEFQWKPPLAFTIEVTSAAETRALLATMEKPGRYRILTEEQESVAGNLVNAGPCQMTISGAKLARRQRFAIGRLRRGMLIEVRMVPVGSATVRLEPSAPNPRT